MNYSELAKRAHELFVKHGDENCSNDDCLMRVIMELSNAVMAFDNNFRVEKDFINHYKEGMVNEREFINSIFRTVEDCFADVVIRLLYFAEKNGVTFVEYDKKDDFVYRPSFSEIAFEFIFSYLCTFWYVKRNEVVTSSLQYIENWATHLGIDLEFFVKAKIAHYESQGEKL